MNLGVWRRCKVVPEHRHRYLWLASVVGFYSLPGFCRLRPQPRSASLTQVIGNCAVLLLLSSALPVISRTLGGWRPLGTQCC